MKYALDTNTIIQLLRENPNVVQRFTTAVDLGDEIVLPPIVHYEMRRGFLSVSSPKKEMLYNLLIQQYKVGGMTKEVLECGASIYADLYHKKLTVEDADLLTAAFCMVGGYTIVTNNTRHFQVINGLVVEDWSVAS